MPTPRDSPRDIILRVVDVAGTAMEEVLQMARSGEPLWVNRNGGKTPVLNEDEYIRTFPRKIVPKPAGFKSEVSRESAVVNIHQDKLVEILMDPNQWSTVFSAIVARASVVSVVLPGFGGTHDGIMQVMRAELHVPTPLVPARESFFVRYSKKHEDGSWTVVDAAFNPPGYSSAVTFCQRRPSGVIIQEMPNGCSKVTWVEHVAVSARSDRDLHELFKQVVKSGHVFGARRWVATLDRQCERRAITSAVATNTPAGRKSVVKLVERMVTTFFTGVGATATHKWKTLSGTEPAEPDDNVLLMTRKNVNEPGRPLGIALSVATSFSLPVPPKRVFDFLCDSNSRNKWDILSSGGVMQEMMRIPNGRDTGNYVSLLRVNGDNVNVRNTVALQESCSDPTMSYVVYALLEQPVLNHVLDGNDNSEVAILPSGFVILPDGSGDGQPESGGSLLTINFDFLENSDPATNASMGFVENANNLLARTVDMIKAALSSENEA